MNNHRSTFTLAAVIAAAMAASTAGQSAKKSAAPPAATAPSKNAFADSVRATIQETLTQLENAGGFDTAQAKLQSLFDQVIAYGNTADHALFRDVALANRMVALLAQGEPSNRAMLLRLLIDNPDLARSLAFLAKPAADSSGRAPKAGAADGPASVLAMLDQLRLKREKALNTYANLAAAICVVHNRPFVRQINENAAKSADPIAIFDYYVANERKMMFGVRDVPPELLVYVVDTTATIDEMNWALRKYAGDKNVGARFFDVDYDYDAFSDGDKKKVDIAGWNLPNILRCGGVCADQAYFAMTVGKAIGVPTTYTVGQSATVGHAWVGFLQSDGKNAWWNFNTGRYEAYQGVKGTVQDPQTRRTIPDSYISLLAEFVAAKEVDRQYAIAMTDAAKRLIAASTTKLSFHPQKPDGYEGEPLRAATTEDALVMLEAGLNACPGYSDGWFTMRDLAAAGKLTIDQKRKWAGVLDRLCGQRYPDFYLAVLTPMIETVTDPKEQNALWNAAFRNFQSRMDLAAGVRMQQAELWMSQHEPAKAGQCYEDVIARYANAGPFVIEALGKAEDILRKAGNGKSIVAMYNRAWSAMKKPKDMAGMFATQSNWYRVGKMYAERLAEAGQTNEAAKVRGALTAATAR